MACISLGTIDKSLIVILVGCVFCFLNRLLSKIKVGAILFQSPILTNIYIAMSRFITVIPFIILTIKTKKKITNIDIENFPYLFPCEQSDAIQLYGTLGCIGLVFLPALIELIPALLTKVAAGASGFILSNLEKVAEQLNVTKDALLNILRGGALNKA